MKKRLLAFALILSLLAQFSLVGDAQAVTKKKTPAKSTRQSAPAKKKAVPAVPPRAPKEEEDAGSVPTIVDPYHAPRILAKAALVFNPQTGSILFEKNADDPRQIASTTKLLTALIIAESGALNQLVQVEPTDTLCEPTKLYFKTGERYTRRDLLTVLLVHSCNDVARALARDNAGSIENFADRMNSRAASLGARNSRFTTPNGLPTPGQAQYSTARDLARIARAAYSNALIRQAVSIQRMVFQYNDGRTREFTNTNKVLLRYPLCNGMKTGYTNAAGHCLVSSATNGDRTVISVCLGDSQAIWNDSQALLQWGLAAAESATGTEL